MMQEFLDSWALFHHTWLAGWLIAVSLSLLGVLTLARDQIFIGAAVTQAASLGVAFAMWAGMLLGEGTHRWISEDALGSLMAVAFSILATLLTSRPAARSGRESPEAITGWVFLCSSSLSILLVAHSPHGIEEIHRLVASSIIGAGTGDVIVFASVAVLSAVVLALGHRPIVLTLTDPTTAAAIGVPTRSWLLAVSTWTGLSVGLSIRVSGMLFTFGCLVLPALVARNLCREIRSMFLVSPVVALLGTAMAFVMANHWDLPPGQVSIAVLCAILLIVWLLPRGRS